jgi:chromo domain-containing protein 1
MAADSEELFVGDGDEEENNDDNISLTSTVESVHDEEKEFVVDAILAERPNKNPHQEGDMEYLIKWENYPLDQCTWEAVGNLSEDLQEQWREQREQELSGDRSPFSLQLYEEAIAEAVRSRAARHNMRNAKRLRLNLRLTEPLPADYLDTSSVSIASKEDSESDDEAMELDEFEPGQPMDTTAPKVIKQTTFKGIPPAKPPLPQTKPVSSKAPESCAGTTKPSSKIPAEPTGKTHATTVWQGTARNPSVSDKSTSKPAPVAPKPQSMTSSTSLKNKFGKSLKATRTQVPKPLLPRSTSASGSIPISVPLLKARKRRTNLKDAMMDPTKPRKLMTNLHRVNQLRKKAAELNDTAPSDPSLIPAAFFITDTQPRRRQSNEQPTTRLSKDSNELNDDAIQSPSAKATSNGPRKDRKSVRFANDGVDLLFEEPMDIDGPTILTGPANARTHTGTSQRKLSLSTYQERSATQDVAKSASFGSEGSREVPVVFNGITRANDVWLRIFLSEEVLNFRAICTSEDFFSGDCLYKPESRLSSGKLESTTDQAALNAVANNLRRASSGFYLALSEYSVLIYPGQCAAWGRLIDPTSPSDVDLRHLIFRTTPPLTVYHYPPLSVAMINQKHDAPDSALIRVRLMREISTLDYKVLQPSLKSRGSGKPAFFLLFHQSEDFLFRILSLWLRACQSDCLIFHNAQEGSWKYFLEETTAGAVILHESVERSIRKIPRLWNVLKYGQHNFWSLSSSDHETKLRPIVIEGTRYSQNIQRLPPQLKMTRLFPHGRAFLITPSFAISEPAKLCQFLQFFQSRSSFAPCVLVACANFPQYLLDLATEKARESDIFRRVNSRDCKNFLNLFPSLLAGLRGLFCTSWILRSRGIPSVLLIIGQAT